MKYIHPNAIVEGDVEIGEGSSVWAFAVVRGDEGRIVIGKNTSIQETCVLHGSGVRIGDCVTVGHGAVIHGAQVGSNVLVGINSTILDGAEVGDNVIIAAGAVVTPGTKVEPNSLYAGVPARKLRELTEEDKQLILTSWKAYLQHLERVTQQK